MQSQQRAAAKAIRDVRAILGLVSMGFDPQAAQVAPESASDIVAGLAVASELADEIAAAIADGAHDCRCV
ncbi:hypothetical protein LCC91_09990 [Tepidimonas taiwanensis]|uniref:Uncharacterized protein n=1 Tax=Tepidimonas taiwanensis TaxID=307486 RepID=A0A554XE87_9BURK|nr:hypothetical protein [Tepidimonas taiwanensis]TSE34143.1 hypothetical protein Ttaiw_00204 [Tepidimonas taiwanensis]UBQ04886.1 hypothetical protein LCC91_09990 [Tepidimonas taiwanensis]